jgi:hypothetical protein
MNVSYSILKDLFGFCFFHTGTHYVIQADLKLEILLPQAPSGGITDICHKAQLKVYFDNSSL